MGFGFGSGDRSKSSRRRNRRVGAVEGHIRNAIRRRQQFRSRRSMNPFSCCLGEAPKNPCPSIQQDLNALEAQKSLLLIKVQQQQQQPQSRVPLFGMNQPLYPELQEQAKELQEEQQELLNDIVKHQNNVDEPEIQQELYTQQTTLLQQMQEFQSAGFMYPRGIPQPVTPPTIPGASGSGGHSQSPSANGGGAGENNTHTDNNQQPGPA